MKNKRGFILPDALFSVFILTAGVMLTMSAFAAAEQVQTAVRRHRREISDLIYLELSERKECVPCSETESDESVGGS